jgi:hypothetical protein
VLVVVAAIHHHIMFQMSRTIQEFKNGEMKGRQMGNTGKEISVTKKGTNPKKRAVVEDPIKEFE